jgi:hypothetical protein
MREVWKGWRWESDIPSSVYISWDGGEELEGRGGEGESQGEEQRQQQ